MGIRYLKYEYYSTPYMKNYSETLLSYPWTPVSDYEFTTNPYLSKNPKDYLESGQFNTDVEVIVGTVADEGIFYLLWYVNGKKKWEDLKNNINTIASKEFFNVANPSDITSHDVEKIQQIIYYYLNSTNNINAEHLQDLIDIHTDASFLHGSYLVHH